MSSGCVPADIIEQLAQAVVVTDMAGIVIGWNHAAEQLYGHSAAVAIGRPVLTLVSLRPPADNRATLERRLGGDHRAADQTVVLPNGELRDICVSYSKLYGEDGRPTGIVGVSIYITAERRAQAEAARQTGLVRALQELATAANDATCNEQLVMTTLRAICSFTGWPVGHAFPIDDGDLLSSPLWHCSGDAEKFAALRSETERLRSTGVMPLHDDLLRGAEISWSRTSELKRSDVAIAAGLMTAYAFAIRLGHEPIGILEFFATADPADAPLVEAVAAIVLQLTGKLEQLRTKAAVEAREANFRAMFENARVGMAQIDLDGSIVDVNPALASMLGYSREELRSRPAHIMVHPDELDAHRAAFTVARETKDIALTTRRLATKTGATLVTVVSGAWVTDECGRSRINVVVNDVSALNQTRDALLALSARVMKVQDDERRRMARDLHDSPVQDLAAVALNLAIVQKHGASERGTRALTESIRIVERCGRELRTLAYLLHPPLLEEVGLRAALAWYVKGFSARSSIPVVLEIDPALPRLSKELETTLFRIVQEGLSNVHRHSGSDTACVHLFFDAEQIVLEVRDRGRGLVAPANGGEAPLLGVGIAGMRERVRQFSGELVLDSAPTGLCVRVTLPSPDS